MNKLETEVATVGEAYEVERLEAFTKMALLDTPPSEAFDRITRLAASLFDLPMSAVSLTDGDRQWFKSRVGISHSAIPRENAPCAQVAVTSDVLVIPDLLADACYRNSYLAQCGIRFYAGVPLITGSGYALGAMCVLGREPRQAEAKEIEALSDLANMVMAQIELQHAFGRIDPVSGQPNRKQFQEDFNDLIKDGNDVVPRLLVMINLAKYEELRDSRRVMGSTFMDEHVREAARRLTAMLGKERILYHVSETQFAFFAPPGVDLPAYYSELTLYLRSWRTEINSRFLTTISIGIVPFFPGGFNSEVQRLLMN